MPVFIDQTGRHITVENPAQRIISLVPSQTELLYDLGLDDEVIGITKFCVHPDQWFRNKIRVGGTKQLNMQTIRELNPDLIIANKEENVKEQVEKLQKEFPVWVSDVNNLEDAYDMIENVGALTGRETKATEINAAIKNEFDNLIIYNNKIRTAYIIWQQPYMTVGADTFIHAIMEKAGFQNIFTGYTRYPEITINQLKEKNCELLLLSSEPFPFQQQHADALQTLLPGTKIMLVDGEMFSWYGSRLMQVPAYLKQLLRSIDHSA